MYRKATAADADINLVCRRFNGHKRTIRPNAKKLGRLLPARHNMTWEEFAETVQHVQKGFMGDPMEVNSCPFCDT
jgi:hypothetical protein